MFPSTTLIILCTDSFLSLGNELIYDSIVNLIGYIDNKSYQNTNLKSILKSVVSNTLFAKIAFV